MHSMTALFGDKTNVSRGKTVYGVPFTAIYVTKINKNRNIYSLKIVFSSIDILFFY